MQVPEFKAAYPTARREAVEQATARLQHATGAVASTLLKLMVDPNVPAAVRLRAADCIVDHAAKDPLLLVFVRLSDCLCADYGGKVTTSSGHITCYRQVSDARPFERNGGWCILRMAKF